AGYDAVRRILREQDAPRPSTRLSTAGDDEGAAIAKKRQADREQLARELRRELDWIPLKALRKDRTERYATPGDLARYVRRYLEGEVLEAGAVAATYRLRKFMKRHRGPVIGASAVMGALVAGLAGTLWQASRAIEQTAIAQDEAGKARLAEAQQKRL